MMLNGHPEQCAVSDFANYLGTIWPDSVSPMWRTLGRHACETIKLRIVSSRMARSGAALLAPPTLPVPLRGVRGWVWPGQLRELPRVPHTQKPSSPYSQDVGPPCQNVEHRGSVQRSRSGQVTNAPLLVAFEADARVMTLRAAARRHGLNWHLINGVVSCCGSPPET